MLNAVKRLFRGWKPLPREIDVKYIANDIDARFHEALNDICYQVTLLAAEEAKAA